MINHVLSKEGLDVFGGWGFVFAHFLDLREHGCLFGSDAHVFYLKIQFSHFISGIGT